jgi:hypothetical protein
MKKFIKNYALSLILCGLFLISWAGQGYFQWKHFEQEQEEHGQEATWENFTPEFFASTFENWQSEFLQLFTFVVLATYFVHKDSPQSRDGDDLMQQKLNRIESLLKEKSGKS